MKKFNKTNKKMLVISSTAFVALMLLVSVALFMMDNGTVQVESQQIKATPNYSLDCKTDVTDNKTEMANTMLIILEVLMFVSLSLMLFFLPTKLFT